MSKRHDFEPNAKGLCKALIHKGSVMVRHCGEPEESRYHRLPPVAPMPPVKPEVAK